MTAIRLDLPEHLTQARADLLAEVAERNDAAHGCDFLGLILSGSAGRGPATDLSDLDVYVVLTDNGAANRRTAKSPAVDEIPISLSELEEIPPFGTDYWWYRWSFAAESMPWLLDVIFTLHGRVRPYHKYLPWELQHHPLPDWTAEELLGLLKRTLDGDPAVLRESFERVEVMCREFDESLPEPVLLPIINGWGTELALFRA